MTKRWLSLVLTLAMLVTMFASAGAAGVVPKAIGDPVLRFTPAQATIDATSGTVYTNVTLGTFTADYVTLTNKDAALIEMLDNGGLIGPSRYTVENGVLKATYTAPIPNDDSGEATLPIQFKANLVLANYELDASVTGTAAVTIATVKVYNPISTVTVPTDGQGFTNNVMTFDGLEAAKSVQATYTTTAAGGKVAVDSWKAESSNEAVAIATVDADGLVSVTPKGVGNTRITVTASNKAGSKSATFNVTVNKKFATGISFASSTATMLVGETLTLAPTLDSTVTERTITWQSGDTSLATVSASGVVTSLKAGTVDIIATVPTETATASATVQITISANTNNVVKPVTFTDVDGSTIVSGTPLNSNKAQTIKLSSDTVGATIYYTVTTAALGSTPATPADPTNSSTQYDPSKGIALEPNMASSIKAIAYVGTYKSGVTAAAVNVNIAATSVTLDKTTATVAGKGEVVFTATVVPANANVTLAFSHNDTNSVVDTAAQDGSTYTIKTVGPKGSFAVTATATPKYGTAQPQTASCPVTVTNVPVTGISLSSTSVSVPMDQRVALTATVLPANASVQGLNVETTGTAFNFVNGYVEGAAVGSGTITFIADGGRTATATVTVTPPVGATVAPVFELPNNTTITKLADLSKVFRATSATTAATITYQVNGGAVMNATEAASFVFENKTYSVTAIATVGASQARTTVSYTVAIAPTGIDLYKLGDGVVNNNAEFTLQGSREFEFWAEVLPEKTLDKPGAADRSVVWTNSNPSVVSMTVDGSDITVKGLAVGTATITAATADGAFKKNVIITVKEVTLDDFSFTVDGPLAGEYADASIDFDPDYILNKQIMWSSSNQNVATVQDGRVVGVAAGTALITAIPNADPSKVASVSVTVGAARGTIADPTITVAPALVPPATTYTTPVKVTLACATVGAKIYYTTNGVAPTENDTLYTAPFELSKSATVWAMAVDASGNRKYVQQAVTIKIDVSQIKMDDEATVAKGETLTLNYEVVPANATYTSVRWTSLATQYATVNATTGLITGVNITPTGTTALIRLELLNGTTVVGTAECDLTVTDVAATSVTINPASVEMLVGDKRTLTATVLPSTIEDQSVVWSVDNGNVVTVVNGALTANAVGTATITATKGNVSATCVVTVKPAPSIIPSAPLVTPTFTPSATTFSVVQGETKTFQLGSIVPGEGETYDQINYFYAATIAILSTNPANIAGSIVGDIDSNGNVTLTVVNAKLSGTFSYGWSLAPKFPNIANQLTNAGRTVSGNTLTVTEKPSEDQLAVEKAKDIIGKLSITIQKADAADEAAAKKALLAKLNEAIKDTGIVLTEADLAEFKFTAATDTANGKIEFKLNLKKGDAKDTVSGSAVISFVPPTMEIKAVAKSGYSDNGKTKPANNRWRFAFADGGAQFSVPGYSNVTWKSSKPKYVSINATTGEATFLKRGTNIVITATVGTTKLTKRINVVNMASDIKLQWKKGSKWVDFAKETPTILLGKKLTVRATAVVPGASAKMFKFSWSTGDSAIVSNSGKATRTQVLTAKAVGSTTVTVKLFNDVYDTMPINVSATKGIGDDFVEEILDIEDIEEEELDEIDEPDEIEEIDEIDEIDEAA